MPPEIRITWTVKLTPEAVADKYKIVRGEAAIFSEVLALLYNGHPPESIPYADSSLPGIFEYTRNGYRIVYEELRQEHTMRVLFFALATTTGIQKE